MCGWWVFLCAVPLQFDMWRQYLYNCAHSTFSAIDSDLSDYQSTGDVGRWCSSPPDQLDYSHWHLWLFLAIYTSAPMSNKCSKPNQMHDVVTHVNNHLINKFLLSTYLRMRACAYWRCTRRMPIKLHQLFTFAACSIQLKCSRCFNESPLTNGTCQHTPWKKTRCHKVFLLTLPIYFET